MGKYRNIIRQKLLALNDDKKVIFSLLICERLLPNYIFFSEEYSFGKPLELKNIILILYENLFEKNDDNIDYYINTVEDLTPNTEDFSTIFVSFALDACTSILSTLYYLKDNDIENIVDVATYARDTVDMYIQERDNLNININELELLIENDLFMKNEKKRQLDDIEYLHNIDFITKSNINILRELRKENIVDLSLL